MGKTKTTIYDVAQSAGVSTATVSRAINNDARISVDTATKVQNAMRVVGYVPRPANQRQSSRKKQPAQPTFWNMAVLTKSESWMMQRPVYGNVLHGLEQRLRELQFDLILRHLDPEASDGQIPRKIDGAILFNAPVDDKLLRAVRKLACVRVMSLPLGNAVLDHVTYNNNSIGRLAAEYLLECGHRNVVSIGTALPNQDAEMAGERQGTFEQTIKRADGRCTWYGSPDILYKNGNSQFTDTELLGEMVAALTKLNPRPTAIFLVADELAVPLYPLLRKHGLEPRRDISVIGCNNEGIFLNALQPRPATIDIHSVQIGRRAAEQVVWRLKNPKEPRTTIIIEPSIVAAAEESKSKGRKFRGSHCPQTGCFALPEVRNMTHRERFLATIERRTVDRPACWLGMPTTDAVPALLSHFRASDMVELKRKLDDDIWPVEIPYHHPPVNHIACAFDFAKDVGDYEHRTLTSPGLFENMTAPDAVEDFPWPIPGDHMDPAACRQAVLTAPEDYARLGVIWSAHFQDACAAFGMENALMTMMTTPDMFRAVIDRIVAFYLEANSIFYEATKGELQAVLLGNDFGSQTGLMLAPDQIRDFVMPGVRRLIAQAHHYSLKVIYHSCDAIADIIPDLIAAGADAIHPIQALAKGMRPQQLKRDFGGQVAFCGGVDAQELLVNGTPHEVQTTVKRLRKIFPTGLIISPSHEAILPDIPPANVEALFQEAISTER